MKNNLIFFLISVFCFSFLGSANNLVKEKKSNIENCKSDTCRINILIDQAIETSNHDPRKAIEFLDKATILAQESKFKFHIICNTYSGIYLNLGENEKAIKYAFELLKVSKNLKEPLKFDYQGRANEKLASIYSNIGNIDLAIKYQLEAIELYKKVPNDNYYIVTTLNLAAYFNEKKNFKQAIYYYEFVESNLEEENLHIYFSYVYNGMAVCYKDQNNVKKAEEFYLKSVDAVLKFTPEDKSSLATAYNNLGNLFNDTKEYEKSIDYLQKAQLLFEELNEKQSIADVYFNLSLTYRNLKDYQKSNDFMMKYLVINDSLIKLENKKIINDLAIKYESAKKEQKNKLLSIEVEKKQNSIYFVISALTLVLFILLLIFRNNRIKTKINKKLESQNILIENQKDKLEKQHLLLEEKNKEVTDSIKYAERIQGAILPPDQKWNYILPNSFVLNKPKDILSGDFYWIAETEEKIFVAAADCTGHGVPGALISIVNFNLLNKAVLERNLSSPAEILDAVNIWLTESLNQSTEESTIKDGMDISLVSIDKKNGKIIFSGANNPLYLFKNNELIEFKANKFPVGAYINETINNFTELEIDCKFGDTIYLFSDGYADQFGGVNGKKYKYKKFKETLFKVKDLSIGKQKEFLHQEYLEWRGKHEQTDDILIIGIKC